MTYLTHPIDNSPTIRGTAGAAISSPGLLAVKFDSSGNLILPAAGDPIIGIVLADEDAVAVGGPLHIQIKDITYWLAGAAIKAGNMLKPDATGKAVVAAVGDAVSAIALEAATSGAPCKVMICHTAIPAAAQGAGG